VLSGLEDVVKHGSHLFGWSVTSRSRGNAGGES
jgi:hypothetical protein